MSVQLLETKFHIPPVRTEYVSRPRLIRRLDEGLSRKVTLVSAPAGFGKTSLISEWISGCGRQPFWLSLDRGDNDPIRFLNYLIGALRIGRESPGSITLSLAESSQYSSAETVLTSLINEVVGGSTSPILMIDDYHVIDSSHIDEMMNFLIENLPPRMHLIISTREDPQLAIARLRASGQMMEIRAADLRFQQDEVAEFMNGAMDSGLKTTDIASLEQRTEGWIASLQLAALSIQRQQDTSRFIRSFTGSHRLVLDYLVEEVLDQQSGDIQDFLVRTSVLDRMCGPLCDRITGRDNGVKILEYLDNRNLFVVPLDDERTWYRYHHLFADMLRRRLNQTRPELIPDIHRQAGDWFTENGYDFEAIDHALHAGDYDRAATSLAGYLSGNFERVSQTTRETWLASFPDLYLTSNTDLALIKAWTLIAGGQADEAAHLLDAAEKSDDSSGKIAAIRTLIASQSSQHSTCIRYGLKALESFQDMDASWRCLVLMTLADAYSAEGRIAEAHQAHTDLLAAVGESNDRILRLIVHIQSAEITRQQGKLRQTIRLCRRLIEDAEREGLLELELFGWLMGIYGEVLAEINDVDQAMEMTRQGVERTQHSSDVYYVSYSRLYRIRVLFSAGDLAGAMETALSIDHLAEQYDMPVQVMRRVSAWKARIRLVDGQLDSAGRWADEQHFDPEAEPMNSSETEAFVYARVLIENRRVDEAIKVLQWVNSSTDSDLRKTMEIESLSLTALAHFAQGDLSEALEQLQQALRLAEPEGFIRIFVDEGPPMARLLYEAISHKIEPEYVHRLLAAFPATDQEPDRRQKSEPSHPGLTEHLSEREIEVLRHMAEGLSNEQIGTRLFISMHTVKVHARNIFSKLDCRNRTEAVARARYFGILASD